MQKIILVLLMSILSMCSISEKGNKLFFNEVPKSDLTPISDYVVYYDIATLPTLYIGMNMLTHTKPSIMHMGRDNTLDITKFPSNVEVVNNCPVGSIDAEAKIKEKIAEWNRINPQATFTFYVNDLRIPIEINLFYSQGINKDRVKVIQLTDGTATYSLLSLFSDSSGIFNWAKSQLKYKQILEANKPVNKNIFCKDSTSMVVASISTNNYMWLQFPELIYSADPSLETYLAANGQRYQKITTQDYFDFLNPTAQEKFIDMVGLNKIWAKGEGSSTLDNQTIKQALDASPKPNIIITGTNPYNPNGSNTDALIAKVKNIYGNKYDYFFKGHPSDTSHPSDNSITVLPFRLPMEAILMSYSSDIAVLGGYQSSLYMTAKQSTPKFFFNTASGAELIAPLDEMYKRGLIGDVRFIN